VRWVYDSFELFSFDLEDDDELDEEEDEVEEEEEEPDEADSFEVSAQGGLGQSLLVWLLTAFDFTVVSSPTADAGRVRNEDPPLANNRPLMITNRIVKDRKEEQDASFFELVKLSINCALFKILFNASLLLATHFFISYSISWAVK